MPSPTQSSEVNRRSRQAVIISAALLVLQGGCPAWAAKAEKSAKAATEESPFLNFGTEEKGLEDLYKQIAPLVDSADFEKALPLAQQAVELSQKIYGTKHPEHAQALNNLGWLLQSKGDYSGARKTFEHAIEIQASLNFKNDCKLATLYNNLAALLTFLGDSQSALPIYEKAVAIQSGIDGEPTADVAKTEANIGVILAQQGNIDQAVPRFEKALAIIEKNCGRDHLDNAAILSHLATANQARGKLPEARAQLERALAIRETYLPAAHPDIAESLSNLASISVAQGNPADALAKLNRSLEMNEKTIGSEHPDVALTLNSIGGTQWLMGQRSEAKQKFLRAAKIIDTFIEEVLPSMSFAEQRSFLQSTIPNENAILLSRANNDPEFCEQAYGYVLGWKGLLISSLAAQSSLEKLADDKTIGPQAKRLKEVRAELANWFHVAGTIPFSEWDDKNTELTSEKEKLERQLSSQSAGRLKDMDVSLKSLRASLKPDECFVDVFQFRDETAVGASKPNKYAAILVSKDSPAKYIELGDAATINKMLSAWRKQVLVHNMGTSQWQTLSEKVWLPIEKQLPADAMRVHISNEGELSRLPWQVFLLENKDNKRILAQLDSARELIELRSGTASPENKDASMLIVGGVDFTPESAEAAFRMPDLPGTVQEAKFLQDVAEKQSMTVQLLTGRDANKTNVLNGLRKADYAHLATHGFFFDEHSAANPLKYATTAGSTAMRNPLLESGLVLAAPPKGTSSTVDVGNQFLTAEEIVGTDLSKCRSLTLSACETGLGEQETGQGVLGLRTAIMSAGARRILMSLWKVPDESTLLLMQFYSENLWQKHMPAAQALQEAQAAVRNQPYNRYANPVEWAGWVLVGESW
jgi:CHAT domain-containing protein/Tfp pilus assembly protein PilF